MNAPDGTDSPIDPGALPAPEPLRTVWREGFATDDDGALILGSYSQHPRPDGTIRVQALYRRKDGSCAEL